MSEMTCVARNGVKIHTYKNPALHGFYISLFVRAGSMYEGEGEQGITHFLEHALVRNVNKIRGGTLYAELDKYALEFNASTYSEMVQFYISGAASNFARGADIIADILSPVALSGEELLAERKRIKAEIRESDDKTSLASFTSSVVFEGTTLSGSILGCATSVDKIGKKRLEEYRKRIFIPENTFLYVTGSFTDEDIDALAERVGAAALRECSDPAEIHSNVAPVPQNFGKRGAAVHIKNADYTMLRFTFDVDMARVGAATLDLIYDMLLSGYSSPFFIEMSEERGLFYDISGSTERYRNIGTLHFGYEVKEKSIYDAVELSVRILNEFKRTVYPYDECMRGGYVDNAYMLFDDGRELGFTLAYDNHIMSLSYPTLEARIDAYRSITPEMIREGACEIFKPENLTLTVKGRKRTIDADRLSQILIKLGE